MAKRKEPVLGEVDLRNIAKHEVVKKANSNLLKGAKINLGNVYIVWQCWILGNWKALLSTTVDDGRYYEFTYDVRIDKAYLDVYKQEEQVIINLKDKVKKAKGE